MSSIRSMIPCIPEPNHLRLIHDCYPKSKTAVEPDSNALGKLTFYTKSRPVKLDKVGKALLRQSQKHGESTATLCVTLSIVKKLLDEGRKDVSVFGAEAMAIIDTALQRAKAGGSSTGTDSHATLELYEKTAGAVGGPASVRMQAAMGTERRTCSLSLHYHVSSTLWQPSRKQLQSKRASISVSSHSSASSQGTKSPFSSGSSAFTLSTVSYSPTCSTLPTLQRRAISSCLLSCSMCWTVKGMCQR